MDTQLPRHAPWTPIARQRCLAWGTARTTRPTSHLVTRLIVLFPLWLPLGQTRLPPLEGKLQKLSTKGRWQTRYFAVSVWVLSCWTTHAALWVRALNRSVTDADALPDICCCSSTTAS